MRDIKSVDSNICKLLGHVGRDPDFLFFQFVDLPDALEGNTNETTSDTADLQLLAWTAGEKLPSVHRYQISHGSETCR